MWLCSTLFCKMVPSPFGFAAVPVSFVHVSGVMVLAATLFPLSPHEIIGLGQCVIGASQLLIQVDSQRGRSRRCTLQLAAILIVRLTQGLDHVLHTLCFDPQHIK